MWIAKKKKKLQPAVKLSEVIILAFLGCRKRHLINRPGFQTRKGGVKPFFFFVFSNIEKHWSEQFKAVPSPTDEASKHISQMAKANRLDRFSDMTMINGIQERSMGAYTHDDVFNMEVGFAYTLALIEYEKQMLNKRFEVASKIYNEN